MSKKVSLNESKKMLELYKQYGSYTTVAKKMRRSRSCVATHIKALLAYEAGANVLLKG